MIQLRPKHPLRVLIRWGKTGMAEGDPASKGLVDQIRFPNAASSVDSYQFRTVPVIQFVQFLDFFFPPDHFPFLRLL